MRNHACEYTFRDKNDRIFSVNMKVLLIKDFCFLWGFEPGCVYSMKYVTIHI